MVAPHRKEREFVSSNCNSCVLAVEYHRWRVVREKCEGAFAVLLIIRVVYHPSPEICFFQRSGPVKPTRRSRPRKLTPLRAQRFYVSVTVHDLVTVQVDVQTEGVQVGV